MSAAAQWRAGLAGLFPKYLAGVRLATEGLHRRRLENLDTRLEIWYSNWVAGHCGMLLADPVDLIEFGLMLGRLAESYSKIDLAERILDQLAEYAAHQVDWIKDPQRILITTGEFKRRRGDLQGAMRRFGEAVEILESNVSNERERAAVHSELGRVFYELGYLSRLRGDAAAAAAAFDRSEVECELAGDSVGVEIARSHRATRLMEEGVATEAVAKFEASVARFQELIVDPAVQAARRDGLARRWLLNVRIHLSQAYLAASNHIEATRLIGALVTEISEGPSALAFATTKRIEAQIWLAQNEIGKSEAAISGLPEFDCLAGGIHHGTSGCNVSDGWRHTCTSRRHV